MNGQPSLQPLKARRTVATRAEDLAVKGGVGGRLMMLPICLNGSSRAMAAAVRKFGIDRYVLIIEGRTLRSAQDTP